MHQDHPNTHARARTHTQPCLLHTHTVVADRHTLVDRTFANDIFASSFFSAAPMPIPLFDMVYRPALLLLLLLV